MIALDDRGLLLGDGLFETILCEDGRLVWLDEHLDRLARGCATLGLPPPDLSRARALCEEAAGTLPGRSAVRLTLTAGSGGRGLDRPSSFSAHPGESGDLGFLSAGEGAAGQSVENTWVPAFAGMSGDIKGPRLLATAASAPAPPGPATLVTATVRRNEGSPASRVKSLSYLDNVLARREAALAGADEALMLNNAGEVACAAAANVLWLAGGRLCTPALDCGALDGIARGKIIARLPAEEVRAPRAALDGAEAVFLTNSLIGARRVSALDGRPLDPAAGQLVLETLSDFLGRR